MIRAFPEIQEFEASVERDREMAELVIRIEVGSGNAENTAAALGQHIHRQLNLRPRIEVAQPGSLPRYELKARRFKFS